MSTTAPTSQDRSHLPGDYHLGAFDPRQAGRIARWVRSEDELFWLAPKTAPPLTAEKICHWPAPDGRPYMFYRRGRPDPIGYFELNPMPGSPDHLWLGHCVIAPTHRRSGLGRLMVDMMLDEAFVQRQAKRVTLVVFPDNLAGIHCYRAAGFQDAGYQYKTFPTRSGEQALRRMTVDRARYRALRLR